ncbi:diaminopropionate ammonia-lyase [Rhizobium pusense]|uniref:diaminopropionate ammonia-lyase n=1 Tax=Agrobacterium pusense TaxID=648995 RepID=UPI001FCD8523|nr:diaminopropionate ammonia-lyase [Agrobacterium pusense]MCJ2877581.1 diaminopropionate ammonia-lyase [Agrobacterium pusense]
MSTTPYLMNTLPAYKRELDTNDADTLGLCAADRVARVLALRENSGPTPLHSLQCLANEIRVTSLHVKDEGFRLGLGSFKALGGAYALMILVQEEASRRLNRAVAIEELMSEEVRAIASEMTFACATDGNHGRSVAQGAQLMGSRAVIFVHAGVSEARIEAIARFGAEIVRVHGSYDCSVEEATRVATEKGWTILSDTSWPGYEYIPGLVSQGYIAMVREILGELRYTPTHVFLQAGVGGMAAAVSGHLAVALGSKRPHVTVVEPKRAACLFESAKVGFPIKVGEGQPTVMAMLECYEPSKVAFRILERVADGFMTVDEEDAVDVMRRLASPAGDDPAIVSGESGGAGLAGVLSVVRDEALAKAIGLGIESRVLVINTEGATDPALYERIVGRSPLAVLMAK